MRFPSKLIYHKDLGLYGKEALLFVADSGNNRVLILDESTLDFVDQIGTGVRGDADGSFDTA